MPTPDPDDAPIAPPATAPTIEIPDHLRAAPLPPHPLPETWVAPVDKARGPSGDDRQG